MGTSPRARQRGGQVYATDRRPSIRPAIALIAPDPKSYMQKASAPEKNPHWFSSESERNWTVYTVGTMYAIAVWIVATANPDIAVWEQAALAAAYTLVIPAALYVLVGLG